MELRAVAAPHEEAGRRCQDHRRDGALARATHATERDVELRERREPVGRGRRIGGGRRLGDERVRLAGGVVERVCHLPSVREAILGIVREGLHEPAIERRRQLGTELAGTRERAAVDREVEAFDRLRLERRAAREREICNSGEREEVGARVRRLRLEHVLGAHVLRRSRGQPIDLEAFLALHGLRDAVVDELHEGGRPGDEEHVLRLQIAMHDQRLVRRGERLAGLRHDLDDLEDRQRSHLADSLLQGLAVEQLQDEIRLVGLVEAAVEDADDVRAVDVRGHPGLAKEARARARHRCPGAGHELHRDLGAEHEMLGDPHAAHSSIRDLANETERAGEDLPNFELHGDDAAAPLVPWRKCGTRAQPIRELAENARSSRVGSAVSQSHTVTRIRPCVAAASGPSTCGLLWSARARPRRRGSFARRSAQRAAARAAPTAPAD